MNTKPYTFIPQVGSKYVAIFENTEANRQLIHALNILSENSRLRIRYRGSMVARRIGRVEGWHNSIEDKAKRDCLQANASHFVVYRTSKRD